MDLNERSYYTTIYSDGSVKNKNGNEQNIDQKDVDKIKEIIEQVDEEKWMTIITPKTESESVITIINSKGKEIDIKTMYGKNISDGVEEIFQILKKNNLYN